MEVNLLNQNEIATRYLGLSSIFLIVGIVLCFLANLGYNSYIKFQSSDKKIEVHAENFNNSIDN